jgi:hypothetical protein
MLALHFAAMRALVGHANLTRMSIMKRYLRHFRSKLASGGAAVALVTSMSVLSVPPAALALEPGAFTQCVAWNNGTKYNIVYGSSNRDRCFQLARTCTGNPNVTATYYSSAVLVTTPYIHCLTR